MKLSPQQQAIVNEGATGTGSMLIEALAGTGKTFSLLELLRVLKGSTALTAFNNKIATELQEKVLKANLAANVGTCHKFGFEALRRAFPKVRIEGKGKGRIGYFKFDVIAEKLDIPLQMQRFCKDAVSLAKQRAIGFLVPFNDPQAWLDLVSHYGLDDLLFADPDAAVADKGAFRAYEDHVREHLDPAARDATIKEALQYACKALKLSVQMAKDVIDFDDMIYAPLVLRVRFQQYDNVMVDEAQDTNPARRALVKAMLKPGGRAFFVGDRNQAIYGFTGADNDSLEIIAKEFGCKSFPLTMTYRCSKAVVKVAQGFVSEYEAFEGNSQGSYQHIDDGAFSQMINDGALKVGHDAILCRNTKPLIDVAFRLIRKGIPCRVEGKAIGDDLIRLVNRFGKKCETMSDLEHFLTEYRDEETETLLAQGKEMAAESLTDRVDTILAIIGGMPRAAEISDLIAKIDEMFEDTVGEKPIQKIILMTAHRSKGLEFERVFVYGRNKYMPSRFARQQWQLDQETNLQYVAVTRAIDTLIDVSVY